MFSTRHNKTNIALLIVALLSVFIQSCAKETFAEDALVRIEVKGVRGRWELVGSGFLLSKDRQREGGWLRRKRYNVYSVMTAEHVLPPSPNTLRVITSDSSEHYFSEGDIVRSLDTKCSDVSVFTFASDKNYEVSQVSPVPLDKSAFVFLYGWALPFSGEPDSDASEFSQQSVQGEVLNVAIETDNCHQLTYVRTTYYEPGQGTSGAPLFNIEGQVVGIHTRRNAFDELIGVSVQCLGDVEENIFPVNSLRESTRVALQQGEYDTCN